MRTAAIGFRRIVALAVVLVLVMAIMVVADPGPASAMQDPCDIVAGGAPVECDPTATATTDPCSVKSAGIDPCDPDPCDFVGEGKGPDPCDPCEVIGVGGPDPCASTATPTPDPCEIVSSGVDPCASPSSTPEPTSTATATSEPEESATPEPTEESCNVAVALGAALGGDECETPEVDETPTFGPDPETETPAPSAAETPTFRETVTSLPGTGFGQGAGPAQQPASTVPLLVASLLMIVAVVGTLTRRRLVR